MVTAFQASPGEGSLSPYSLFPAFIHFFTPSLAHSLTSVVCSLSTVHCPLFTVHCPLPFVIQITVSAISPIFGV